MLLCGCQLQVFLKKIRPNSADLASLNAQAKVENRVPKKFDFVFGYLAWFIALFLPGFHHFYLGEFWKGVIYLVTLNQLWFGWLLDLCEMHVLVQQSVQKYGNCSCCYGSCCGGGADDSSEDDVAAMRSSGGGGGGVSGDSLGGFDAPGQGPVSGGGRPYTQLDNGNSSPRGGSSKGSHA
jgi:TM2 domain-containing membrane protein YozV